jgi:hypothetical protein
MVSPEKEILQAIQSEKDESRQLKEELNNLKKKNGNEQTNSHKHYRFNKELEKIALQCR